MDNLINQNPIKDLRGLAINQIIDIANQYTKDGDFQSRSLFLNQQFKFGWTILFERDYQISKELIDAGIDVNILSNIEENALSHCLDIKTMKLLIKSGANIHQLNKYDENITFRSKLPKTKLLIDNGINIHHVSSFSGGNALFTAPDDSIPLLIEKGVDMYCVDKRGLHPAFVANERTLPSFLKKGYDINTEIKGKNLLSLPSQTRNYDFMAFLILSGINYYHKDNEDKYFFENKGPYANVDTPFDFKKLYKSLNLLMPKDFKKYSNIEILNNIRLEIERKNIKQYLEIPSENKKFLNIKK